MPFEPIQPAALAPPSAPYSTATKAGDTLYVSGQLARDDRGAIRHPGNVRLQTDDVLRRVKLIVEAAGGGMADIAMVTVVLRYRGDRAAFDDAYAEHFGDVRPARLCLFGELVQPDALVEIAAVAHLSGA